MIKKKTPKKHMVCSDECEHCIYIGDGDYFCDAVEDIVISDWFPCNGYCILNDRGGEKK